MIFIQFHSCSLIFSHFQPLSSIFIYVLCQIHLIFGDVPFQIAPAQLGLLGRRHVGEGAPQGSADEAGVQASKVALRPTKWPFLGRKWPSKSSVRRSFHMISLRQHIKSSSPPNSYIQPLKLALHQLLHRTEPRSTDSGRRNFSLEAKTRAFRRSRRVAAMRSISARSVSVLAMMPGGAAEQQEPQGDSNTGEAVN